MDRARQVEATTKVTLYDAFGRVVDELRFPRGKVPGMGALLKQYPNAERIVML